MCSLPQLSHPFYKLRFHCVLLQNSFILMHRPLSKCWSQISNYLLTFNLGCLTQTPYPGSSEQSSSPSSLSLFFFHKFLSYLLPKPRFNIQSTVTLIPQYVSHSSSSCSHTTFCLSPLVCVIPRLNYQYYPRLFY